MIQKVIVGILFTVLEIAVCVGSFYFLTYIFKGTDFPFSDSLFNGVMIGSAIYAVVAILLLILLAVVNQRITKERFNYKLAVPSLIVGSIIAYLIVDSMRGYRFVYETAYFDFLMLVISYSIPITTFNIGIRIQRNL